MTYEEISKIDPQSGRVYLRGVFIVAFFLPGPINQSVSAIDRAFDLFLAMTPKDTFRWASVGASSEEWKPFSDSTIARCKAQLRPDAAAKRKMTAFELVDSEVGGSVPHYGITVLGEPLDGKLPNERTLFQMSFPISLAIAGNVENFIAKLVEIAAVLPVDSGYGSPAIQWAQFDRDTAIKQSRAIVAKHPGYDINLNTTGRTWIGSRVRGARWLSFLGPQILEALGGSDALRKKLPTPFEVQSVGSCVMVRAGRLPEIGDTARSVDTPLLREVAEVLEPVTAFEEVVLLGSLADWDKDTLRKWERRFLDRT